MLNAQLWMTHLVSFCAENEICHHLFFAWVFAKNIWKLVSDVLSPDIGIMPGMLIFFLFLRKAMLISAASLRTLLNYRNAVCSPGHRWKSLLNVWDRSPLFEEKKCMGQITVNHVSLEKTLQTNSAAEIGGSHQASGAQRRRTEAYCLQLKPLAGALTVPELHQSQKCCWLLRL